MRIYELTVGGDDIMYFFPVDSTDFDRNVYAGDGKPRGDNWYPPRVRLKSDPFNDGKKAPDIGHIAVGGVVLSQKAVDVLKKHLTPYGELLPLDVEGETYYLYNVTNVIDAIDQEKSVKSKSGMFRKRAFRADRIPADVEIFKVPEHVVSRIFFNETPGENIKNLIEKNGLIGARFRLEWEG